MLDLVNVAKSYSVGVCRRLLNWLTSLPHVVSLTFETFDWLEIYDVAF